MNGRSKLPEQIINIIQISQSTKHQYTDYPVNNSPTYTYPNQWQQDIYVQISQGDIFNIPIKQNFITTSNDNKTSHMPFNQDYYEHTGHSVDL